jgi:hypothetical protein
MNALIQINETRQDIFSLTPVQSACCAPAAVQVEASDCGCEAGKPVATVTNAEGNTVSACCGKPVNTEVQSSTCCG